VQQTQSLGHNFGGQKIDAGRIAARPGKAGDQTQLDRVFGDAEDDRDRRGRGFGRRAAAVKAGVAITANRRRTRSAMSDDRRSNWPLSQWYSTVTFWPSMVPVSLRPLRNAAPRRADSSGDRGLIHSTYKDNHRMLLLSRGMDPVWINDRDAARVGIGGRRRG
jgi:hypothetical protein